MRLIASSFHARLVALRGLFALLCLAAITPALAQGYPNRPINLIVGFTAGGSTDSVARLVAEEMRKGTAYKTVIGELKYDKKGDITRPDYVMYTWKKGADGKISYVQN